MSEPAQAHVIEWTQFPFGPWRKATPDMKPCPKCGSPAALTDWGTGLAYTAGCDSDKVCTQTTGNTPEEAIAKWDRREGMS